MSYPRIHPTEVVIEAYQQTGSVWAAAKRLGMSGQAVWERLRAVGYPMRGRNWTTAEIAELQALVGTCTIGEIARRLGRPYGGVATMISKLGIGVRYGNRQPQKLPRGAGYDKRTTQTRLGELERYAGSLRQFCRANAIAIEPFVVAVQRHFPDRWDVYAASHTDLAPAECPNCGRTFYPMSKKQRTCSRRCATELRRDLAYFGGNRKHTIGLAEGVCQLCLQPKPRLSSHHLLGKENDPDNECLIALCAGCHQIVSHLAGRKFVDETEGWENLIGIVLARRLAEKDGDFAAVHTYVDIEYLAVDELAGVELLDTAAVKAETA